VKMHQRYHYVIAGHSRLTGYAGVEAWNLMAQRPLMVRHPFPENRVMKTAAALFAVAALALVSTSSADAKGCLKGAVVGGVAGHYAGHHGVLGAAAGCLYGRHRAKEQDKQQQGQGQPAPAGQEKL
jgi:hypothetical protein